jgi:hypothetical protein
LKHSWIYLIAPVIGMTLAVPLAEAVSSNNMTEDLKANI